MSVGVYVAHAKWAKGRAESYAKLRVQLPDLYGKYSLQPEHASVWAPRLWAWAADSPSSHAVFLNDDVEVCPDFLQVCGQIGDLLPDDVVCLHATPTHPLPVPSWFRSYWLTGPGYVVPTNRLPSLLKFAAEWAHYFTADRKVNEDGLIMQWLYSGQTPAYHCVPALVRHNIHLPSTCGHDDHPGRASPYSYDKFPDIAPTRVVDRALIEAAPLIECPWRSEFDLRVTHLLGGHPPKCALCDVEDDKRLKFINEAGRCVCPSCARFFHDAYRDHGIRP